MTMAMTSEATDFLTVDDIISDVGRLEPDADEPFDFLDGLDVLCRSLTQEAHCTPDGLSKARNSLAHCLATQVRVRRNLREAPEIAVVPVERPVFIIGLPRTGTTLLHNILSLHSDLRCPNLWELVYPAGLPSTEEQEKAADAMQNDIDEYYRITPRVAMVHMLDARRPDECRWLLANAFYSPIYWIRYDVPSYVEWFLQKDAGGAYAFHLSQLKNILWRIRGGVPLLKDPFHIWNLDALARAYPAARYIHLHRDPVASISSTCSMTAVVRETLSNQVDRAEIGRFWAMQIERVLSRLPTLRRTAMAGKAILDIRYQDLTRDPIATVKSVCRFIGIPFSAETERRARAFLAENPLQKKGVHTYSADEFGLSDDGLRERFVSYRENYGV
ncbi:MAG TPA: sulfotransferase [Bradyrhizobium sp.]|nr:sulfotransferase [Bradyrhizobium sp.]